MNFLQAFEKVNPKQEQPAAASKTPDTSNEDLKAYIDAKIEGMKLDMDNKMKDFLKKNNIEEVQVNKVETPEENINAASQINEEKGGIENASKSDL